MICAWKELLNILPIWLREPVDRQYRDTLQEVRLRLGCSVQLHHSGGRTQLQAKAGMDDLQFVINSACRYSPWTATGAAKGYVTALGGHRVGICGDALMVSGQMTGIRSPDSVNIRVARDFPGIAGSLTKINGSILICGRPGSGKTTLLRDLIRQISAKQTVCVVDERGELFGTSPSRFDRGGAVDILTGCGKAQGLDCLLRTMSPDVVAVDEITAAQDCQALLQAGWCGVRLLATAHAGSRQELVSRPVYRPLLEAKLFDTYIFMEPDKSFRAERGML